AWVSTARSISWVDHIESSRRFWRLVEEGGGLWRLNLQSLHQPPLTSTRPSGAIWVPVRRERLAPHRNAVARRRRRHVAAVTNDHRVQEMLVQVVHVLDDAVLERGAHADVVEDREVLHVLAQPDPAGVRAHGN